MKKHCQVMSADSAEQHGKSVRFGVHAFRDFRVSLNAEPDLWFGIGPVRTEVWNRTLPPLILVEHCLNILWGYWWKSLYKVTYKTGGPGGKCGHYITIHCNKYLVQFC